MKKSGVILILLMISVLLISVISSISFVSASLISDTWGKIWSKITGKVTEENITTEPKVAVVEPGLQPGVEPVEGESCPQIPVSMLCPDEKTLCPQTKDEKGCLVWNCNACGAEPKEDKIICCAITPILEERVPTRYELRLESQCNPASVEVSYAKVSEEYCIKRKEPLPELKPVEGQVSEPRPAEVEEKPVPEPEVCAVKIKVSSNQKVYYIGDNAEIIVEIFDEQGNLLPNYPFYGQTYDGKKWQSPSKESTGREGNYRNAGRIKESDNLLGKVSFKVFTKMAGCDSVEDILEVEIKKGGEKEEICGIGVCVPEEEKVKEIPKEKEVLYSCTGCKLENKCYPFGYRKAGGYCSEAYEFVSQKEEGACENNFECESNVCVSGECVSESLMKKIIAWFKGLFGKEKLEELDSIEPKAEMCSDRLVEKNIGDYEYSKSAYGDAKELQAPLYSEKGERIGVVKCCGVKYIDKGGNEFAAMVCPYDSREELYNSLNWLSARGEIYLDEYKEQKLYTLSGKKVIIWANNKYIIAVGSGPDKDMPEDIASAYLKKYPNDLETELLEKIEKAPIEKRPTEPVSQPPSKITEEFLIKAKSIGEVTLIDFETLPDGTVLQNGDRLTGKEWESLGVVFETPSEEYLKVFGPNYPFNPLDKLSLSPGLGPFEDGSETHDDLNIIFTEPVKAAGLYLLDLGETDERESIAFLDENGNVLYKISPWPKSTFGNPAPGTFVSFISEKEISKIEIKENIRDADDIAYDNLYFVKYGHL